MGGFCWWSFNCKSVILGGEGSQDILEQLSFLWLCVVCNVSYNAWDYLFASYEALMLSFTGNFLSSIVNKDT